MVSIHPRSGTVHLLNDPLLRVRLAVSSSAAVRRIYRMRSWPVLATAMIIVVQLTWRSPRPRWAVHQRPIRHLRKRSPHRKRFVRRARYKDGIAPGGRAPVSFGQINEDIASIPPGFSRKRRMVLNVPSDHLDKRYGSKRSVHLSRSRECFGLGRARDTA